MSYHGEVGDWDFQWVSASQPPTHGDAVLVMLRGRYGYLTYGLASYPLRPKDCDVELNDGWKLWYCRGDISSQTVVAWRDLERLTEDMVPMALSGIQPRQIMQFPSSGKIKKGQMVALCEDGRVRAVNTLRATVFGIAVSDSHGRRVDVARKYGDAT